MPDTRVPSRRTVATELRRLHAAGRSIRPRALRLRHPQLWSALVLRFGSVDEALSFAGITSRASRRAVHVRWDKGRIVGRLRARYAKGKDVSTGAVQRTDPPLAGAIFRHFGSHDGALAAAGIDAASVRKLTWWDRDAVLADLRRRNAAGEPLSVKHLSRHASPLYGAMNRLFGSCRAALRAAGIDPEAVKEPWPVIWPTEKIIAGIRAFYARWWADHPQTEPPQPRLSGAEPALANAARSRFGRIGVALAAAGVHDPTYRPPRRWNPGAIIAAIKRIDGTDGGVTYTDVVAADGRLVSASVRHFGSVRAAVEAAGRRFTRHPRRDRRTIAHWTEELVLQTLRNMDTAGHDLRYRPMQARSQPLFWAAKHFFGSYVNAVRQAGIDYWSMSQAQLTRQRGTSTVLYR